MLHDTDYERISALLASKASVSPDEYALYLRERRLRTVGDRQPHLRDLLYYMKRETKTNDLPLFQYADHRFHLCPYCGSRITFSQLGHAHRWKWCPYCHDSSGIGRRLPDYIVITLHKHGESGTRSLFRENSQSALLSVLHLFLTGKKDYLVNYSPPPVELRNPEPIDTERLDRIFGAAYHKKKRVSRSGGARPVVGELFEE